MFGTLKDWSGASDEIRWKVCRHFVNQTDIAKRLERQLFSDKKLLDTSTEVLKAKVDLRCTVATNIDRGRDLNLSVYDVIEEAMDELGWER